MKKNILFDTEISNIDEVDVEYMEDTGVNISPIPTQVLGDASEQNSTTWLEWRQNFRTASKASTVFGVNPFENIVEMKKRDLGLIPNVKINNSMSIGIKREDEVRKKAEQFFNKKFTAQCWEYGKYAASLDGIDEDGQVLVELKVSNYTYSQLKKGYIPENYKIQVMQQLMCSGAKKGYVVAMHIDSGEIEVSNAIELEDDFYDKLETAWLKYENLSIE